MLSSPFPTWMIALISNVLFCHPFVRIGAFSWQPHHQLYLTGSATTTSPSSVFVPSSIPSIPWSKSSSEVSPVFVRTSTYLRSSTAMIQTDDSDGDISFHDNVTNDGLLPLLRYRPPTKMDIDRCFEIESASYPSDEAASLMSLRYRQEHASEYFQLCTVENTDRQDDEETTSSPIIGFVCGTRCDDFTEESMSTHKDDGRILAIHSVVVDEAYRRRGVATAMLRHYVHSVIERDRETQSDDQGRSEGVPPPPIQSMMLLAKKNLLSFYVNCGFQVNRPSPIVHGQELWYELERRIPSTVPVRSLPHPNESWFCKTEQFIRPFPQVKPYLEEHTRWVHDLRQRGYCITSGYRVDRDGRPGGGGLMFLAAKSYDEARELVLQDPLVANDCVEWELNGWIGQVGNIQMR